MEQADKELLEVSGDKLRKRMQQKDEEIFLVIDRASVSDEKDDISRLMDSAETAFYEGDGACRPRLPAKQHLLRLLYPVRS